MPCGGLAGGCGAWAVSRKTPIYFILCIVIHIYGFPLDVVSDPFNSESAGPLTEGIPYVKSHLE